MTSYKNINYKISEIHPNVFAIEVPKKRDLVMLFLRVQEFYESPNSNFFNKAFNIDDFVNWYNNSVYRSDNYLDDWSGFNFPYRIAKECYYKLHSYNVKNPDNPIPLTLYDITFLNILNYIDKKLRNRKDKKAYIIGAQDFISAAMKHEIRHALFYTNRKYRYAIKNLIDAMPKNLYFKYKKNLNKMGYRDGVIHDEIQSYLGTNDWKFKDVNIGIDLNISKQLHTLFKKIFNLHFHT